MAWIEPQGQLAAVECPHNHFKTNVIDRDILTKRQHLNLLCTPKGYRWEIARINAKEGCDTESKGSHCKTKRSYVYKVLADVWSVVTPEMVAKLQEMMELEFGLSKEEAAEFVCRQIREMIGAKCKSVKQVAIKSLEEQRSPLFISKEMDDMRVRCRRGMSVNVKPRVVKKIAQSLAEKLTGVAMYTTRRKRAKKQRRMSEVLFNGVCKISGDKFDQNKPKSKLHELQLFLIDKLSMWLAENIVDENLEEDRRRKIEDKTIQVKALRKAKQFDKKLRERAALERRIELQRKIAEERNKEILRKDDEAKRKLREKTIADAKKNRIAVKNINDRQKTIDAENIVGEIVSKVEMKGSNRKKEQKSLNPKQKEYKDWTG